MSSFQRQDMTGVREYDEGRTVRLDFNEDTGRYEVIAYNEGGHACTVVDLLDLIEWLRVNRPELLAPPK